MVRPTRFTEAMFQEYFSHGMWSDETTPKIWELNATGLKRDEFIYLLLPNWVEAYIFRCAAEKAGVLVGTSLMTVGDADIEFILEKFDAVGIVIPLEFRKKSYLDLIRRIRPGFPNLKHVFIPGEGVPAGASSLERLMMSPSTREYGAEDFRKTSYGPTDVSVIGFTSGTTGMPKGAEHIIAARIAMAKGYGEGPQIREQDIVLNIISPVAGLSSAFCYNGTASLVGAKVVLSDIWSPEKTFELIEAEKATVLLAVPAQLAQIHRHPARAKHDLGSLRCIVTSTAPLSRALARDLEETFKVPVCNLYGQIDGGFISCPSVDDTPEVRQRTVGRPHKFTTIRIIDDDGNDVPQGEEGELVYSGPSTTGGYFRNMPETMRAWGKLGPGGMRRSGDLVQMDADGRLMLLGRKDDMIIRGGSNIYPAELESLLITHPKIEAVAIVPMPDEVMGETVCAFVQVAPGETLSFDEMIGFLKGRKTATYKLPERLEIRESLPLRGTQKIGKMSLKKEIVEILRQEGKL
ncbi:MAG: AMP-binding protein [Betaproteobacteria bacterium]|nr:AMP-binding protein [Betaproteobacteria bacterium]